MDDDDNDEMISEIDENFLEAKGILPLVYEGEASSVPDEFNAVCIRIDGTTQSDLDWKQARQEAKNAQTKGLAILWEIDLGLFDRLVFPINHESQFLSLTLSLEHFRDMLWKEFREFSLGLCVYRGSVDFQDCARRLESDQMKWVDWITENVSDPAHLTEEQTHLLKILYHQSLAVDYLRLLAGRLMEDISIFLMLDCSAYSEVTQQLSLLNPERFEGFKLILKGATLDCSSWGWGQNGAKMGYLGFERTAGMTQEHPTTAICVPLIEKVDPFFWKDLESAVKTITDKNISFRLISEAHLITSWEGVDHLIYCPKALSSQGRRKLRGFCAAGGTVVTVGERGGFSEELPIDDWLKGCAGSD